MGLDYHLLSRLDFGEEVRGHRAAGGGHALHPGEAVHVLLGEPQGGQQLKVKHGLPVQVVLTRSYHVRLADAQSGEKSYAQPHDGQDGQVASQALADFPQSGAEQRSDYHSISSTGTGASLTAAEVTVPFFT